MYPWNPPWDELTTNESASENLVKPLAHTFISFHKEQKLLNLFLGTNFPSSILFKSVVYNPLSNKSLDLFNQIL